MVTLVTLTSVGNRVSSDRYEGLNLTRDQLTVESDIHFEICPVERHLLVTLTKILSTVIMKTGIGGVVLIAENIIIDDRIADMIIKFDVIVVMNTVIKVACVIIQVVFRCQAKKTAPSLLKGHSQTRNHRLLLNV